jgi:acetylglutamate kinase
MTMIGHTGEQAVTVRALRGAAPYMHMYKGKIFVIKTGGGAFRDGATMRAFVEQIAILHHLGIRVVLVHGGGPQLDLVAAKLGVQTRMVQGRRVTDGGAIDVACMVLNGLVNTRLLALCRELGIRAVGISGVDGGLVKAHKRAPVTLASGEVVDYGMVGDIDGVDGTHSLISYTDVAGLRRLREEGALTDGMLPKSSAIETAIRGGVRRVHVISYSAPDALLAEVFTNEGTGTLVVRDTKVLSAAEQGATEAGAAP